MVDTSPHSARSWPSSFARDHTAGAVALGLIVVIAVGAFIGPLLSQDPNLQDLGATLQPPNAEHLLGTDRYGRDILARLIEGTRTSLIAAAQGVAVAALLGIPLGLAAGYFRGVVDAVFSRVADALLALPGIILAIGVVAMLGPGLTNAMIAVGIVLSPMLYRVARAAALSSTGEVYIDAAKADGCSTTRLLTRYVLFNSSGPLLVQLSLAVGSVIAAEAGLSFLGLGAQPPASSLGTMTREAFDIVTRNSYSMVPSTVTTVVIIAAFFVLGDALRDSFGNEAAHRGSR